LFLNKVIFNFGQTDAPQMREPSKYLSKMKPPKCPHCGAKKVVDILYGYPSDEGFEKADKGELVIGGCIVSGDNPSWQCTTCNTPIYQPE
jgi:hypothetical protein